MAAGTEDFKVVCLCKLLLVFCIFMQISVDHENQPWKMVLEQYVYPVMLLLGKEQSFIICRNTMRGFYLNNFGDKFIHPQLKQCCLRDSCSNVSNYWENREIYMATKALIFVPKKKYHVTVFLVKGYCRKISLV